MRFRTRVACCLLLYVLVLLLPAIGISQDTSPPPDSEPPDSEPPDSPAVAAEEIPPQCCVGAIGSMCAGPIGSPNT
jgi:hypothetical protein